MIRGRRHPHRPGRAADRPPSSKRSRRRHPSRTHPGGPPTPTRSTPSRQAPSATACRVAGLEVGAPWPPIGPTRPAICASVKLLLLHPLPLDGSIFPDALRTLADECFAPTLYAHGDDVQSWARAALDLTGGGPLVVVGNSVGGSCAIELARLAPDEVEALVLCGTKPGHRPEPAYRDEALHLLEREGMRAAWERYWRPLFGPDAPADVVDRGWQVASRQGIAAIGSGVRAFHSRPDREAFLRSWAGPTWIVSGEHDIRPERARRLAESLPRAQFHLLPGSGHYIPLEHPDALVAITRRAVHAVT